MPIPQVTDRIKEAPAVVLRAVFAGIGQLLMAVDKIRAQVQQEQATSSPAGQQRPSTAQAPRRPADEPGNVTPLRERPAPAAEPAPEPGAAPAVKTAARGPAAAAPKPAAAPEPTAPAAPKPAAAASAKTAARTKQTVAAKAATPKPATTPKRAATQKPAAAAEAGPATPVAAAAKPAPTASTAAQAAPIPGYDDLSIASLRARLRGLDAEGVRALIAYEKANAHRDDVITMFERRLSKIENGTG
jgi:hypothetical protein